MSEKANFKKKAKLEKNQFIPHRKNCSGVMQNHLIVLLFTICIQGNLCPPKPGGETKEKYLE